MKTYVNGSTNRMSKIILKFVSTPKTFLERAQKEEPEKLPFLMKIKHKVNTQTYQDFDFHTINEKSKNNLHIVYFHGGALCLNGGLAEWMMIDKWVKKTDAKASYVIYPLIPQYKTQEIYDLSYGIYEQILSKYPNDEMILIGSSAGGLVILSILQLIKKRNIKKPALNILLSPWIDFSLSHPDIPLYETKDKVLSLARFKGIEDYDNLDKKSGIMNPLEYEYDEPIHIYGGTNDMLYPDMLLFEDNNPKIDLKIYYNCPHVFMLLPMKQSKVVHKEIIESINELKQKS